MTQETKQKTEFDNLLADLETVEAPETFLKEGEVISRPTEDVPVAMGVTSLRYKGYIKLWYVKTGREILQPQWLLWQTLVAKDENGDLIFTRTNPHIPPDYGADLFCPLNVETHEFLALKAKGFKACKKQHIPHYDGMMQHVRKSHKRASDEMERARTDRMREEDRELQRDPLRSNQELIRAVASTAVADRPAVIGTPEAPLYVSDNPTVAKKHGRGEKRGKGK